MRGTIIWLLAAIFFLYEFFLRTFVSSIAHQVIPDLHLTEETFTLITTAYFFTYGIMQVPAGLLADKLGVRKILTVAVLLCVAATFIFTHTDNFYYLYASRLLMGFGSAFAFICLLTIVFTWFPVKHFGFIAGFSQFVGTIGPMLAAGPFVAVMLASHKPWQWLLNIIAYGGFILAFLIYVITKDKKLEHRVEINSFKRFCAVQSKRLWLGALASALIYVPMNYIGAIWGTQFLEHKGLTQNLAADMMSAAWLGYAIGCPLLGWMSDRLKKRKIFLLSTALLGLVVSIVILYLPLFSTSLYLVIFVLFGLATSGQSVGFVAVTEKVKNNYKATALGICNGSISFFVILVPPILTHVIDLPRHFAAGLCIVPIAFGMALLFSYLFQE